MRLIARKTLVAFWAEHPRAKPALRRWAALIEAGDWATMDELQQAFASGKALNGERMRFEIAGGNYRLIASFNFRAKIAFVKFLGTHREYDAVDALTVSHF
jgi:mRNA interferase HigB